MHCGDKPGVGIEIDETKLKELEVPAPTRSAPAASPRREGAGLYIVPLSEEERIKIR